MQARPWLTRYVFRRDLVHKVRSRALRLRRKLGRNEIGDATDLLAHRPVEVVFDLGANVGYVTAALRREHPDAQIHAFEPTPATFAALQQHLGGEPGVHLHQVAVGDQDGPVTFRCDNQTLGGGANSMLDHNERFHATQPSADYQEVVVDGVRLDTFCAEHGIERIDLLKLDVEGAELKVVDGASSLLGADAIDAIATEVRVQPDFVDGPLLGDVVEALTAHGYRLFGLLRLRRDGDRPGPLGQRPLRLSLTPP